MFRVTIERVEAEYGDVAVTNCETDLALALCGALRMFEYGGIDGSPNELLSEIVNQFSNNYTECCWEGQDYTPEREEIERPDGKVFHRNQAGDESDEYSSGDIAPDEDGFLGEAIDDPPINGPKRIGGSVCRSPMTVVLSGEPVTA